MRFERMIFGLGNHCSILLSYEAIIKFYHKNGDFTLRFFSDFQPAVNQPNYNTKSNIAIFIFCIMIFPQKEAL